MDKIINDSISFNKLKLTTIDIENLLNNISTKNEYIKKIYINYVKNKKLNDESKISLDILNYQTQLIQEEHCNTTTTYKKFINNMYGHYYKLHNKYCSYINEISKENEISITCKNYNGFSDLDDTNKFTIDDSEDIFNTINEYNVILHGLIKIKNQEIINDNQTKNSGIYLNNFINKKTYDVNLIEEKLNYLIEELLNFYNFHYNYIYRLKYKLSLELKYIDNKINSNIFYKHDYSKIDKSEYKFKNMINRYKRKINENENENENINENKFNLIKLIKNKYFYITTAVPIMSLIFYKIHEINKF